MVLAGNEGPSQSELERTINMLIERQTRIDKRVERLESLEGTKWDDGRGCVSFVDYDTATAVATAMVEVNPDLAENGDFIGSQAMIFWKGACTDGAAMVNLYMRIQNNAVANYYYSYKYSRGAALSQFGLGAQTEMLVGRLPGNSGTSSYGCITVPYYSNNASHMAFGDWTAYDISQAANTRQEKGEWGGLKLTVLEASRFDFFPAAGNFSGFRVYLYIWCPQTTPGGVPDD